MNYLKRLSKLEGHTDDKTSADEGKRALVAFLNAGAKRVAPDIDVGSASPAEVAFLALATTGRHSESLTARITMLSKAPGALGKLCTGLQDHPEPTGNNR